MSRYTEVQLGVRRGLEARVKEAEKALEEAINNLGEWANLIENNVFDSIEDAEQTLEEELREDAHSQCAGAYMYGPEQYVQPFRVLDKDYVFVMDVEYNRHDKTYYYVDGVRTKVHTWDEYQALKGRGAPTPATPA